MVSGGCGVIEMGCRDRDIRSRLVKVNNKTYLTYSRLDI